MASGFDLLRTYQRETKLDQTQLAERFGVSPVLVHYWLSVPPQRTPGLRAAHAIERATGGAIPAESWLHDGKKSTAARKRKAARRGAALHHKKSPKAA